MGEGIYPGLSYADYEKLPGLRISTLKYAEYSARHLKWALDGKLGRESTDALRLGSAIHMKLLEPERFEIFMPVASSCCAELKSGSRKGEPCGNAGVVCDDSDRWYCGQHRGMGGVCTVPEVYVTQDEHAMIEQLNHEIRLHPVVKMLRRAGGSELSAVADISGVTFKCRIDKLNEPHGDWPATVIDIKTKQPMACSVDECRKAASTHGYHVQAYLYRRILQQLKGYDEVAVIFVFVEKGEPFDVAVIQAGENDMLAAENEFNLWLRDYKHGMETGEWPGVCSDIEQGLLPSWHVKRWVGNYA